MQMKLAVMTHSTFFVEEDKILTTLFNEGMENLHLCKWEASPIYSERLLSLLNEDNRKRTTVHDNFYLKNEFSLASSYPSLAKHNVMGNFVFVLINRIYSDLKNVSYSISNGQSIHRHP